MPCINIPVKRVKIIDNMLFPPGIKQSNKYVEVVTIHKLFVSVLNELGSSLSSKVSIFRVLLWMSWQTTTNTTCSCVYLMRHIETYDGVKSVWEFDIPVKNVSVKHISLSLLHSRSHIFDLLFWSHCKHSTHYR